MTQSVPVLIVADDKMVPLYAQPGDAGADLRSSESLKIAPGERKLVHTGVSIALPAGYVGLVHPRSGLALTLLARLMLAIEGKSWLPSSTPLQKSSLSRLVTALLNS